MKKYKLIATDMDGTLLNSEKNLSENTKNTLISLQKQGVKVMLCSGRQLPGMFKTAEKLELYKYNGIISGYNGGKILKASTKETLYENPIPNSLALKILKHLENFNVAPLIDSKECLYTNTKDAAKSSNLFEEVENTGMELKKVDDLKSFIDFNPVKILVVGDKEVFKAYAEDMIKPFKDEIDFSFSAPHFLEINKKGINKGNAVKEICKILNISPEEVIAFGDGGNDIEMFKVVGLGVAMSNAIDELKNIANEVTLSNNEDGLVHTLNKYFKIN